MRSAKKKIRRTESTRETRAQQIRTVCSIWSGGGFGRTEAQQTHDAVTQAVTPTSWLVYLVSWQGSVFARRLCTVPTVDATSSQGLQQYVQ